MVKVTKENKEKIEEMLNSKDRNKYKINKFTTYLEVEKKIDELYEQLKKIGMKKKDVYGCVYCVSYDVSKYAKAYKYDISYDRLYFIIKKSGVYFDEVERMKSDICDEPMKPYLFNMDEPELKNDFKNDLENHILNNAFFML